MIEVSPRCTQRLGKRVGRILQDGVPVEITRADSASKSEPTDILLLQTAAASACQFLSQQQDLCFVYCRFSDLR